MRNAWKLGPRVINADHVIAVEFDRSVIARTGPHHVIHCLGEDEYEYGADSPEGRALKWFLTEARWVALDPPYPSFDLVALHRAEVERSTVPPFPGAAKVRAGPLRERRTPVPLVAEACTDDEPEPGS